MVRINELLIVTLIYRGAMLRLISLEERLLFREWAQKCVSNDTFLGSLAHMPKHPKEAQNTGIMIVDLGWSRGGIWRLAAARLCKHVSHLGSIDY